MALRSSLYCVGRLKIIFALFGLVFLLVIIKLFDTQVLKYSYWINLAKAQQTGLNKDFSKRGNIYASDEFPIALSVYSYDLTVNPNVAPDNFDNSIEKLFEILYKDNKDIDKEQKRAEWRKILSDNKLSFSYLERGIDYEKKEEIKKLKLEYVFFDPIPARSYPDNESYSHILGFLGKDKDGNFKGSFGLEGFYDGDLNGIDGFTISQKSAGGFPILFKEYKNIQRQDGASLVLSIDRNVHSIAYEEIKKAVKEYDALSGSVIILNPENGDITALANFPSFNPLDYAQYFKKDPEIFVNKAVSSTYEPGSVIKALTVSAAVDLGLVNENTLFKDEGPEYYSGLKVDNWDGKHHGSITTSRILELSNNIGAAKVGSLVGRSSLFNYFTKFGISKKTGIDLEGEESGYMRSHTEWEDIDLASTSFGQSISATPLQITSAFGAIANNGVLVEPHLVTGVKKGNDFVKFNKQNSREVLKKETADLMVKMLTNAASSGEAKYFMSKKYLIAGKTGTAQIAEEGKYLKDATNATFVGFLPKYKQFVMLVKLERPKVSVYASETAVPTWMRIAERVANYYGFSPDKNE